jgi:hypothetical protein
VCVNAGQLIRQGVPAGQAAVHRELLCLVPAWGRVAVCAAHRVACRAFPHPQLYMQATPSTHADSGPALPPAAAPTPAPAQQPQQHPEAVAHARRQPQVPAVHVLEVSRCALQLCQQQLVADRRSQLAVHDVPRELGCPRARHARRGIELARPQLIPQHLRVDVEPAGGGQACCVVTLVVVRYTRQAISSALAPPGARHLALQCRTTVWLRPAARAHLQQWGEQLVEGAVLMVCGSKHEARAQDAAGHGWAWAQSAFTHARCRHARHVTSVYLLLPLLLPV